MPRPLKPARAPHSRRFLRRFAAFATLALLGCQADGERAGGDAGLGGACVESELVAQCPGGSSPVLGASAETRCGGAIAGLVENGQGHIEGICQGVAGCRVLCNFAEPCLCGVARITRDAVICADCATAASCGNDLCEGGETPETCPIDCGRVCTDGETRCDGELLESCNLQGRYDRLPCPRDEVCQTARGVAACARRPDVILGDAGVGGEDGGFRPIDGRVVPGDGTLPVIVGVPGPEFPRQVEQRYVEIPQDDGYFQPTLSDFGRTSEAIGGPADLVWRPLGPAGEGGAEAFGATGRLQVDRDGVALPQPPLPEVTDWPTHCALWTGCGLAAPAICGAPEGEPPAEAPSPAERWVRECRQARCTEDPAACCAALMDPAVCRPVFAIPYPEGVALDDTNLRLAGQRLLAASAERDRLVVIDLDTGGVRTQALVGDYRLHHRNQGPARLALSADGQVAAAIVLREQDYLVQVWDLAQDTRRGLLPTSSGEWQDLALSPDGQVLAITGTELGEVTRHNAVALWNLAEERRIVSIGPHPDEPTSPPGRVAFSFSPDGTELLFDYGGGQRIEVWPVAREPEKRHQLDLPEHTLRRAAYAPDGHTVVVESSFLPRGSSAVFAQVGLWDTATGQRWLTLPEEPAQASTSAHLAFSADGQRLVVAHPLYQGRAGTILRLVDPASGVPGP